MARITIALTCQLLFLFTLFGGKAAAADVSITHLQTEYNHCPLGIDVTHPRFSWQMETSLRGYGQAAYQLEVREPSGKSVWNSGKAISDISVNIRYAGQALKPRTRYQWWVTVWDKNGGKYTQQSWFETGLMETGALYSAWNNARWIGGNDLVCYSPYLPVFRLQYTIQLDEASHSTRAGFMYGVNDPRLLNRDKNFMHLQSPKDSSWILVELDINPLQTDSAALIHIYRAGYSAKDVSHTPLRSFRIPAALLNKNNRYNKHTFYLSSVLGDTRISMDTADKAIAAVNLNPLGAGGDFIAYPVAGELGLFVPRGQKALFSDIAICNYRSPQNVLFADKVNNRKAGGNSLFDSREAIAIKDGVYTVTADKRDFLQCALPKGSASPMLRTAFTAGRQLAKARLYVSARGVYDFYINGKRIGDDYFNPGLTQYNKTQLYQTFDVTSTISNGKNAMGAVLAEGWWSGGATYTGDSWNFFGDKQSLLAQLILTYTDGKEEVVVTTPAQWKSFEKGPLLYGSFFQGEVYDAGRE